MDKRKIYSIITKSPIGGVLTITIDPLEKLLLEDLVKNGCREIVYDVWVCPSGLYGNKDESIVLSHDFVEQLYNDQVKYKRSGKPDGIEVEVEVE